MKTLLTALCLLLVTAAAQARTVRATDMDQKAWSRFSGGQEPDLNVEFRQGDELPLTFTAKGDFLETSRAATSYVLVKRTFWVRASGNSIEASLDGVKFKPISQIMKGSLTAGAGGEENGGLANQIGIVFEANQAPSSEGAR